MDENKSYFDVLKEHIEKIDPKLNSDDFISQLNETFNSAVDAKVSAIIKEKGPEIEDKAVTELTEFKTELVDKLSVYLDKSANEFVEKYEPDIKESLKASVYENLFENLMDVFRKFNVNIPEREFDISSKLQEEIERLEAKVNSLVNENMNLEDKVLKEKCIRIRSEKTKDMSSVQKEKLDNLMESVEFSDEHIFEQKLDTMISTFLNANVKEEQFFKENMYDEDDTKKFINENNEDFVNEWVGYLNKRG